MTADINSIRMTSFNCRGWKSSSNFVTSLMDDNDLLLIQEHWLLQDNLNSLNIRADFMLLVLVVWRLALYCKVVHMVAVLFW